LLSLGSNLGDRLAHLRAAVDTLGPQVRAVSPLYETEPVGGPPGQGAYLNIVVEIETDLGPRELLAVCHRLEAAADRTRDVRWGPRTLDVDILLYDDLRLDTPDLEIPHPRMYERRFVMAPLADVAPDLVPPDWEEHVTGEVARVGELDLSR
jgi:2-amino-4-hydroxy-6-hydroxymethyldihydropteridine diphosphokinase